MKRLWNLLGVILVAVLCFCSPQPTTGAENGGNGDGSGGGANSGQALRLTASSVVDGQSDVPIDATFDLEFSNNVVNLSIAANNRNCFVLRDGGGSEVPVAVVMGDEQVDPTVKRNISVVPAAPLEPGTVYTLLIKKNLSAKNGNTLTKDLEITFATAGTKAPAPPTANEAAEETKAPDTVTGESQRGAAATTEEAEQLDSGEEVATVTETATEAETTPPNATKTQLKSTKLTYVVIVTSLVLAICFVLYFRKR